MDYSRDEAAWTRSNGHLLRFRRHGIEIPYPIQMEGSLERPVTDEQAAAARRTSLFRARSVATLTEDHGVLSLPRPNARFADGEAIVRQGGGGVAYIVVSGRAAVVLDGTESRSLCGPGRTWRDVAADRRSTHRVGGGQRDVLVLEIGAAVFASWRNSTRRPSNRLESPPHPPRRARRRPRAHQAAAVLEAPEQLPVRMRQFLRL